MKKFLILCVTITMSHAKLIPFLDPCKPEDTACILTSAKKVMANIIPGNEVLGIPILDPLKYNDTVTLDTGEMKLSMNNIVTEGLGKCTFNKLERDLAKSSIVLITECPLNIVGNYEANGRLMVIDFEGNGPFQLKGDKMRFAMNIRIELVEKNGIEHYKIKNYDFKYEPLSKFVLHLENMYNGDKAKAEPIEKLLEENTNMLIKNDMFGRPIVSKMLKPFLKIINQIMKSLPRNEFEIV